MTATDTEDVVKELNNVIDAMPVDSIPVFDRVLGIRAAYADPPYIGQAQRHYACPEVDHRDRIERLETYDAWVLSIRSVSLQEVLPLCPNDIRVAAWVKPYAVLSRT